MKHSMSRSSTWQNLLRSAALIGASLAFGGAMAQKIDDVPPAVKNNTAPNFMFMIDNSGSMDNVLPEPPYDASVDYSPVGCTGGNVISPELSISLGTAWAPALPAPGPYTLEPRIIRGQTPNLLPSWPEFWGPGEGIFRHWSVDSIGNDRRCFARNSTYYAKLVTFSASLANSGYSGNYLNWYFGTGGGHPVAGDGWGVNPPVGSRKPLTGGGWVRTRMDVARASAADVVGALPFSDTAPSLRIGLTGFSTSSSGGRLRVPIGPLNTANRATLLTSINGLRGESATPLASTLADIGSYLATGYSGNVNAVEVTDVPINDFLRKAGNRACLLGVNGVKDDNICTGNDDKQTVGHVGTPDRPIQYWCQRSYVFLMTDGLPTNDRALQDNPWLRDYDRDCAGDNAPKCLPNSPTPNFDLTPALVATSAQSGYLDDVAKALFDVDLRPNLLAPTNVTRPKKNNVVTYTIAFADPLLQSDPLLINTAAQGGGKFLAAASGPALVNAFREVITDALAKDASAAAVAVTNAQITAGSVGYASSYDPGTWSGDLEAYSLDLSTGLQVTSKDSSGQQKPDVQWSARERLNALSPSLRKIASFNGSSGLAFTSTNAGQFSIGPLPAGRTAGEVIDWMRGVRELEDVTTNPLRKRVHLLGDIINAEPVVVNYPTTGATVFQAANDGMLHVFDGRVEASVATRGQELWAYVPRLIHNKLGDLANANFSHKYLVDGTPAVAELTGFDTMTRILVGGLGKGGGGYYALDITSGTAATQADAVDKVKWEFNPANMGYSFGTPLIVNTASGWKVVVTSGYRNDTAPGGIGSGDGRGRVWVLNPGTGAIEKTFTTPIGEGCEFGCSTDSLGLAHLGKRANTAENATVRYVYGGDLKGNLWRFDLNANDGAAPVRIAALTGPTGAVQPVTSAPVVGRVSGSSTKVYVYVGTGQYFSDDDVPGSLTPNAFATQTQTMYGITDDTTVDTPALPTRSTSGCGSGGNGDLVCQALTRPDQTSNFTATANEVDLSIKKGFYVDLPIANLRVNNPATLTVRGTLVVVANEPTNLICNPGGNSYVFALSGATGGAIPKILGGDTYFEAGGFFAGALSSRGVLIRTADGERILYRLSNKETKPFIPPNAKGSTYKRIYKRALN